jgi:hypothetical protein
MPLYILEIDSFESEETTRLQNVIDGRGLAAEAKYLYAVIAIDSDGAHLVDDGYRSRDEALQVWPDAC